MTNANQLADPLEYHADARKEDFLVTHLRKMCTVVTDASLRYVKTLRRAAYGARAIMEVGVGPEAVSGQTFAAAMGKGGYLYSIDIDPARPTKEQKDFVKAQGVRWKIDHGDSLSFNVSSLGRDFDLLYIDGDHGADHVAGEIDRFAGSVKPGGLIIFDDSHTVEPVVRRFFPGAELVVYDDNLPKNGHLIVRLP